MKYRVEMSRTAVRSTSIEVEGENEDDVIDKAYEMARDTDFSQGTEWDDVNYCIEEMDLISPLESLEPSVLDGLVHELASEMASTANNNGLHGQLEFLKTIGGMTEEDILARIN